MSALAMVGYQRSLPIYRAEGTILQVHVYMTGKEYRTSLRVGTSSGTDLVLRASDRSVYFRPGERLIFTYQGETGSIISATFMKGDGTAEGQFRGTGSWPAYALLAGGILIFYFGFKMKRLDPEGAKEGGHRNAKPYGPIDKLSLMRLSNVSKKDDPR